MHISRWLPPLHILAPVPLTPNLGSLVRAMATNDQRPVTR